MSNDTLTSDLRDSIFAATRGGTGPCPKCRSWLPPLVECAVTFFQNGFVGCKECGASVDLWIASLEQAIHLKDFSDSALLSLGATQSWFTLPMETGRHYVVDLAQYQIPTNAKILARRYAAQGGVQGSVTAVEWYPSGPARRVIGSPLSLLGVPVMDGPQPRTGQVLVNLTWVGPDDADAWPYLARAFDSAAAREYEPALVFAQSAVEISMMPLIENRFRRHVPEKRVKRFTNYSRALNVVLPYLCGEAGLAQMPPDVHDALEKLRDRRNRIIHVGTKAAAITPAEAMEGLCAAAFGFEYMMRYVRPALLGKKP